LFGLYQNNYVGRSNCVVARLLKLLFAALSSTLELLYILMVYNKNMFRSVSKFLNPSAKLF